MAEIWLSDEQTRRLREVAFPIVVLDFRGMKIAEIGRDDETPIYREGMTDDELGAEIVRRREVLQQEGGIFYTTKDVAKDVSICGGNQAVAIQNSSVT
jgi:hypothetical protein